MADETTPPTDSSDDRTDLIDLVRERMTETGLTENSLAKALIDPEDPAGKPWSRATLQNFLGGKPVKVRLPELRALAAALDLPLHDLQDAAAAQYFGMDALYRGKGRALIPRLKDLSPEDLGKVEALIDEFLNP